MMHEGPGHSMPLQNTLNTKDNLEDFLPGDPPVKSVDLLFIDCFLIDFLSYRVAGLENDDKQFNAENWGLFVFFFLMIQTA